MYKGGEDEEDEGEDEDEEAEEYQLARPSRKQKGPRTRAIRATKKGGKAGNPGVFGGRPFEYLVSLEDAYNSIDKKSPGKIKRRP